MIWTATSEFKQINKLSAIEDHLMNSRLPMEMTYRFQRVHWKKMEESSKLY